MKPYSSSLYKKVISKDTFIGKYMSYMDNQETPEMYDFWSAIYLLSTVLGRNIQVNRSSNPLFLNFYIVLLGDSGVSRKSTAVRTVFDILKEVPLNNHLINSPTSVKDFQLLMARTSNTTNTVNTVVSEFVTFFKKRSVVEFFTDMYDCPDYRSGYNGAIKYEYRDVYFNLFAASTPSYYLSIINDDQLEGGFSSRAIILPATEGKRKICFADRRDPTELIKLLTEFSKMEPTSIKFTENGARTYIKYYKRARKSGKTFLFRTREPDFVLKLATIFSINRGYNKIDKIDVENAIKIINKQSVFADLYIKQKIFTPKEDNYISAINKVRQVLLENGENGITYSAIVAKTRYQISTDELKILLTILHELNFCKKYLVRNGSGELYAMTDKTKAFNVQKALRKYLEALAKI